MESAYSVYSVYCGYISIRDIKTYCEIRVHYDKNESFILSIQSDVLNTRVSIPVYLDEDEYTIDDMRIVLVNDTHIIIYSKQYYIHSARLTTSPTLRQIACTGCIENQPNQMAHQCLMDDDFDF